MDKGIFLISDLQLQEIQNGFEAKLQEFAKNFQPKEPKEYLTRSEVAEMLSINLSTLHNWCKKGKLKPLGCGARVYFLRSQVEECLKPITDF
ncbi:MULTISPECIES: helix-turn-helix domain-containing protein [unclassified Empedobacter]|uniref:helix-turn-helix domain-containing protein n=1 Tax=unclassified Empedobacter TaxID=2643773 RepID=UPI0025C1DF60|nr:MULTISPECIES: helix-turn-helix domain-containing protein [unclassified Empedobacter]